MREREKKKGVLGSRGEVKVNQRDLEAGKEGKRGESEEGKRLLSA